MHQFPRGLGDIVKSRNQRIDYSPASLPPIYRFLLFAGGFVTLIYLASQVRPVASDCVAR